MTSTTLHRSTQPLAGGAASTAILAVSAVGMIAVLLWFYSSFYSLHQDLAGSALSGRLAVTLGESFDEYSLYFPPAERAWFSLAARLSDITGLGLDLTLVTMISAAIVFSTGLAWHIRRVTVGASPVFFLVSLAVLVVVPILFKNIFGLREHMVALGLWPYLVLRISDPDARQIGWKTRAVLGLWMGTTLLLKYLYAIVVMFVEVVDALIQRRPLLLFRIENLLSGSIVALYLFFWLVIDPSQREAIGAVVSAIDANLASQQTSAIQAALNLMLALYFLLLARMFNVPPRVSLIGLALVTGTIIAAWIQARWYTHHLFPVTMAYGAWWWMVSRDVKPWAHLVAALFIGTPVIGEHRKTALYQGAVNELELAFSEAGLKVEGKRVGVLIMHPTPYSQVLTSAGAVRWNTSMNNAYVAAELKYFDLPENADIPPPPIKLEDPGRQMLHDDMLRLWEDMPPDALIIDKSTNWPLRHIKVDFLQVFSEDERFQAILARYELVLVHEGKDLDFRYYVRAE